MRLRKKYMPLTNMKKRNMLKYSRYENVASEQVEHHEKTFILDTVSVSVNRTECWKGFSVGCDRLPYGLINTLIVRCAENELWVKMKCKIT